MPEEKTPDQTPRNPGENPGQSLRAVNSPSEGAEDKFPPRFLGKIRQKAHSVLDALLMDMLECAQGGENDDQSERTERDAGGHRRGHRRGAGDHHQEGPRRREGPHLYNGLRGVQKAHAPMREEPGMLEGDRLRDEWGAAPGCLLRGPRPPRQIWEWEDGPPHGGAEGGEGQAPSGMHRGEKDARRERGITEEGPGRESRAFFVRGKARVARQTRSLRPDAQESWGPQTRPAAARMICRPLHSRSNSSRIPGIPEQILPWGILLPGRQRAQEAHKGASWGIRAFPSSNARRAPSHPASLPSPPRLPPPHGRKGQRKMERVYIPTPRVCACASHASAEPSAAREAGEGDRKNDIPCTRDAYGRIMHARTRARLLYGSMHREKRILRNIYVIRS